jgi:hypothetical protein
VISPITVAALAYPHCGGKIPLRVLVGIVENETANAVNEIDTDPGNDGKLITTLGLGQITVDEYRAVMKRLGFPGSSQASPGFIQVQLLEPNEHLEVLAELLASHLDALDAIAIVPAPDRWALVGIAHNEGLGAAETTLKNYGRGAWSWTAYKIRNLAAATKALQDDPHSAEALAEMERVTRISHYGDNLIKGGSHWADVVASGVIPSMWLR